MALDTVVEFIAKVAIDFVLEVLFVRVFYWPGWLALRGITFGRYPPKQSATHNKEFVGGFGFAILLTVAMTMFVSNLT